MTYTVFNDTNKEIRFVDEKSCARLALITIIVTHQLRFSGEMWVGGCGGVKKVKPLCLAPQQNIRHAPQAENIWPKWFTILGPLWSMASDGVCGMSPLSSRCFWWRWHGGGPQNYEMEKEALMIHRWNEACDAARQYLLIRTIISTHTC
jgi:hypothetical protein